MPGMTELSPGLPAVPDRLPPEAEAELAAALGRLRRGQGLLVRLADLVGGVLSSAGGRAARGVLSAIGGAPGANPGARLPARLRGVVEAALARAFDVAVLGLERSSRAPRRGRAARAAVTASGAASGLLGMAGFLPDAGFTTLVLMREIARIAREEGEDLTSDDARRACLEVFLLASPRELSDEAGGEPELSYFSARLLLQGRPVMALIEQAASRYGLVLSNRFAAGAVPVAGALCGAALNNAFMGHYRELARAHFTIRRLERGYGAASVRAAAGRIGGGMR